MKKKIISLLLAGGMILSMAACGDSEQGESQARQVEPQAAARYPGEALHREAARRLRRTISHIPWNRLHLPLTAAAAAVQTIMMTMSIPHGQRIFISIK